MTHGITIRYVTLLGNVKGEGCCETDWLSFELRKERVNVPESDVLLLFLKGNTMRVRSLFEEKKKLYLKYRRN